MSLEPARNVSRAALAEARAIVERELVGLAVRAYLFGSRADGTAARISDIDIGVLPTGPSPFDTLARLRSALDDSTIPYAVDVVDLSRVAPAFRDRVIATGIQWIG